MALRQVTTAPIRKVVWKPSVSNRTPPMAGPTTQASERVFW